MLVNSAFQVVCNAYVKRAVAFVCDDINAIAFVHFLPFLSHFSIFVLSFGYFAKGSVWQIIKVWQGFCHFERSALAQSEKSIRMLNTLWIYGYFAFLRKLSMTMRFLDTSLRSVWQEIAKYDKKIAKYDEIYQYDKNNKIRQNKSVWQILGFCLNFYNLLCKSALILRTMTKNLQKFTKFSSRLSLKFKRAFQPFANKTHKSLATFTKLLWNFFRKVLTN